jgi:hypothetical protein
VRSIQIKLIDLPQTGVIGHELRCGAGRQQVLHPEDPLQDDLMCQINVNVVSEDDRNDGYSHFGKRPNVRQTRGSPQLQLDWKVTKRSISAGDTPRLW